MTWDYDEKNYSVQATSDPVWRLERLIKSAGKGVRFKKSDLVKHLSELKIPENRRAFLELLVWNQQF